VFADIDNSLHLAHQATPPGQPRKKEMIVLGEDHESRMSRLIKLKAIKRFAKATPHSLSP